jgi:hypothetical protein
VTGHGATEPQPAPSVALIGPRFFSYLASIGTRLAQRGYRTEILDDLHSNAILSRILYRLRVFDVVSFPRRRYLNGMAQRIISDGIENVILVSAESPDRRFVKTLVDAGCRVHVFMWDSVRNKPRVLEYLDLLHGRASFDPDDCARLGMSYIPLFAEDVFSARKSGAAGLPYPVADLGFCGTLHSNRAKQLLQAIEIVRSRGGRVLLQLFYASRAALLVRSIVNRDVAQLAPQVSTSGFPKTEVFQGFRQCRYVLDLPHPAQVGLTIRTFEVLRAGGRLLTTSLRVKDLLPGDYGDRVVVIRDMRELPAVLAADVNPPQPLSERQDYLVSIDRFVDDLLTLTGLPLRA